MTASETGRPKGARLLVRGWSLAVIATVPAALLHSSVHGHTPTLLALGVATVLAAALCVPLVGSKFSRWRSAAAIALSQACYHVFFSAAVTEPATSGRPDHSAHLGLHPPSDSLDYVAHAHSTDGWMLAAHAAAAAITISLFWYGEAVLRSIVAAWGGAMQQLHALVVRVRSEGFAPAPIRVPSFGRSWAPLAARVANLIQGRAPPAFA